MDNTDLLSQYIISYTALKAVRCDALQEAAHIAPAPWAQNTAGSLARTRRCSKERENLVG